MTDRSLSTNSFYLPLVDLGNLWLLVVSTVPSQRARLSASYRPTKPSDWTGRDGRRGKTAARGARKCEQQQQQHQGGGTTTPHRSRDFNVNPTNKRLNYLARMPKKLKKQLKRSSRRLLNSSTSVDNEITEGDNGANQSAIVSPPREEEGAPQPQPRPQQQQPQPLPSYRRPGDFLQGLLSRGKRGLASGGASMGVSLGGRGGGKGAAASAGDTGDAAVSSYHTPPSRASTAVPHCSPPPPSDHSSDEMSSSRVMSHLAGPGPWRPSTL